MLKTTGALEVLAAVGLILPAVLGIVPVLVPLAAVGLVLLMVGAAVTHARRGESRAIVTNVVLVVLASMVAWGRAWRGGAQAAARPPSGFARVWDHLGLTAITRERCPHDHAPPQRATSACPAGEPPI
jgi:hypothetical protein